MPCAKALLAMGADVNGEDQNHVTPLFHACRGGQLSTIRFLHSAGADVNLPALADRWPPLSVAAHNSRSKVVEALLALYGADVRARNKHGWTALHHAVAGTGDWDPPLAAPVRLLLAFGSDAADHLPVHAFSLALGGPTRRLGGTDPVMALLANTCQPIP